MNINPTLIITTLFLSCSLVGCIGDDLSTSERIDHDISEIDIAQNDCEDAGGTWIEATDRVEESYCEMDEDEDDREDDRGLTQEDCEERGGTWHREDSGETHCELDQNGNDREDREITQEDCEERGGTWHREDSGETYCELDQNGDDREDREITQEDCERRGGNWTAAPDRDGEFYCDFGEEDSDEERTISGIYCLGTSSDFNFDISPYQVTIMGLGIELVGEVSGTDFTLTSNSSPFDSLSVDFTFSERLDTGEFSLTVTNGNDTFYYNALLTQGACDYSDDEINTFVNHHFVSLDHIEDISKFRSSAGHDYSDEFETCRSMKHYFSPPEADRINDNIPVYSPVNGTVVVMHTEENGMEVDDGLTNQKISIRSADYGAYEFTLFHIDLLSDLNLSLGSTVTAGELLGYARFERNNGGTDADSASHDFDIAVSLNTHSGTKYISIFDVLTDNQFEDYITWFGDSNMTRSDFIISEIDRNDNPLTCEGEEFTSFGDLSSWINNL